MSNACPWRKCNMIARCSRIHGFLAITLHLYLQLSAFASDDDGGLYSRYSRDAYHAARNGGTKRNNNNNITGKDDDDSSHENINRSPGSSEYSRYDPDKCTTYLAQSSIPNAGLGIYTTTPYEKGEVFPYPEIAIIYHDNSDFRKHQKLLSQYPWCLFSVTLAPFEVTQGESVVPGMGALTNNHFGLKNMEKSQLWRMQLWKDGTDSLFHSDSLSKDDPGRGAHSWHGHFMFEASKPIEAGEELFLSYGDGYFKSREEEYGFIPGEKHFKDADELLQSLGEEVGSESSITDQNASYMLLLKNANETDRRLRAALPDNVQDVPAALEHGTARFSAKDSIRSTKWLEENGACIGDIVSGVSTIPQAGKGAFATRSFNKGQRITITPLIPMKRADFELRDSKNDIEGGDADQDLVGHQLMLNYCFGNTNSSLLFYPYAPTVNFFNHGSNSNAELRWSTLPYQKAEWLDLTLDEIANKTTPGMLFDVIATRKIRIGEEVLLNYGKDWEESWNQHIEEWGLIEDDVDAIHHKLNLTDRLGLPTAFSLNQVEENRIARTQDEQLANPYPAHIMTMCYFDPPVTIYKSRYISRTSWKWTFGVSNLHPCTILYRGRDRGKYWYTSQVEVSSKDPEKSTEITLYRVQYMPRYAIQFVDRPYSKDQYARGVFRHAIGLPDEMFPSHWMDLKGDEER